MIKKTIFICLENYTYGNIGEPDNCIFIKGKLYNVDIDDYKHDTIKIIDDNGHWIRFCSEKGYFSEKILPHFIELKEYRKEKLKKIKLNYEKSN